MTQGQHASFLSPNRAIDGNEHFERDLMLEERMEYEWVSDDEEEDDVHEGFLYSALFKLSHIFELNESLKEELTAVTCRVPYSSESKQCQAVQDWIEEHAYTKLNSGEILNLIKYMELYEPPLLSDDEFCGKGADCVEVSLGGKEKPRDYSHLDCPFRCDIAVLSAEIQRQHLSKIVPQYSDTERGDISRSQSNMSSLYKTNLTSLDAGDNYDVDLTTSNNWSTQPIFVHNICK